MPDRPDLDADQALQVLDAAWDAAIQYWRDDLARQFDSQHWTPLRAGTVSSLTPWTA